MPEEEQQEKKIVMTQVMRPATKIALVTSLITVSIVSMGIILMLNASIKNITPPKIIPQVTQEQAINPQYMVHSNLSSEQLQGLTNSTLQEVNYERDRNGNMVRVVTKTVPNYAVGELIVKFTTQAAIESKDQALSYVQGKTNYQPTSATNISDTPLKNDTLGLNRTYKFKSNDSAKDMIAIAKNLEKDVNIEFAEPNYINYITLTPNDPSFSSQWALQNTGQTGGTYDADIDAPEAWDINQGNASTTIAIVDTGVDYNHQDLSNNMLPGYDFVDLTGMPELSSCADDDCLLEDNDPMDSHGHGTHVSGIIAAESNNNIGIAGICPDCSILPVRAGWKTTSGGGALFHEDIDQAIRYAVDNGADIISMSIGGSGSSLIEQAVQYAKNNGVILIAAAGNNGSMYKSYPAGYDDVIAVSATDHNDQRAGFSNYGSWVDVAAPGVAILSTLPNNTYAAWSGTSMATPYVSGLVGLLLANNPSLSTAEIRTILHTGVDVPTGNTYLGTGRINAANDLLINFVVITELSKSLDDKIFNQNGIQNIKGTATGPEFSNYSLYYGQGAYPNSWTPIVTNVTTPVNNNVLATFNTTDLEDGYYYTIKLVTENSNGSQNIDMVNIRKIFTDISSDLGALVYSLGDPNEYFTTTPLVVDLNNDGNKEYIVGSGNLTPYAEAGLYVFDQAGNDIGSFPFKNTGGYYGSVAVADLDSNGDLEIVVASENGNLYAFNHDGSIFFERGGIVALGGSGGVENIASPVISDLDNNGTLEIVLIGKQGIYTKFTLNSDGSDFLPPISYNDRIIIDTPTIGNIYGDSNKEISYSSTNYRDQYNEVYVIGLDNQNNNGFPVQNISSYYTYPPMSSPTLWNINNEQENYSELFLGHAGKVYALSNSAENLSNAFPLGAANSYTMSQPIIADLENDGVMEMIYTQGGIYVWSMANPLSPTIKFYVSVSNFVGPYGAFDGAIVGDITGDGKQEIIVRDSYPSTLIYAFDYNGNLVANYPKDTNHPYGITPLYEDVESDGWANLVTTAGGNIYNLNHIGVSPVSDWPKWYHDNQNTNNADYKSFVCGNTDNDPAGLVNIADIMYLVDFVFKGGPQPIDLRTANIDGDSEGAINVADLTWFVNYLFRDGPEPSCSTPGTLIYTDKTYTPEQQEYLEQYIDLSEYIEPKEVIKLDNK